MRTVISHRSGILDLQGGEDVNGHDTLSAFKEYCENARISLEVGRIYNPSRPGAGMWFGLTRTQRETLVQAVQRGYYAIPRETSTNDLARGFGVSDQAVTERLRRAISGLVENTLIAAMESSEPGDSLDVRN